ncbi:MAG: CCA tRNA nucleotidyltransferase [Cyanobacteria bacterium J06635_11]
MSAFCPDTWPFPIALLPAEAHLVGGSVRDQLLHRQSSYLDLDFVLPQRAIETAAAIAKACDAGFVVLDAQRQIARVVFEQITVDFAQQQGESLEADLRRRDFTINAIAYHPITQSIVDPLGGKQDISRKTIRMVSADNLAADPLRLMRAYRQAAQLNFTVEPDTQQAIHQLSPQIKQIAVERIRSELDALLSVANSDEQFQQILCHELLSDWLPHFDAQSIERMRSIDTAVKQLGTTLPEQGKSLLYNWPKAVPPGSYRSWVKAAKLSCLVSPERAIAQKQLATLSYSRFETQIVLVLLKAQPAINRMCSEELSRSEQFFLFKLAGEAFLAVSLLALAQGVPLSRLEPMIARFWDREDAIAHAQPLITGHEVMQQLNMSPGPELGQLLSAIEQAQANGLLTTKEDTISWLIQSGE